MTEPNKSDDFDKPKILWKRIGSILRFAYDDKGHLGLDSTCLATGKHISYLACVLNSDMGCYLLKDAPKTGTGDLLVSVQAIDPIKIPFIKRVEEQLEELLCAATKKLQPEQFIDSEVNRIIFELYGLSTAEMLYVGDYVAQFRQS